MIIEWQWYAIRYKGDDFKPTVNKVIGRALANNEGFEVGDNIYPAEDCHIVSKVEDPFKS